MFGSPNEFLSYQEKQVAADKNHGRQFSSVSALYNNVAISVQLNFKSLDSDCEVSSLQYDPDRWVCMILTFTQSEH